MTRRDFMCAAAREGRVLIVVLAMAAAYVAGSAQTDCWGLIMPPKVEAGK